MLDTHTHTRARARHHLYVACIGNTNWRRQGTLQRNNALSEIGEDFLEKCPDPLKPEDEGSMILINIGMHLELHDVI
jgi:hypothetical protein